MSYLIISLTALLISIVINIAQGCEISCQEARIKSYKWRIYRLNRALDKAAGDPLASPEIAMARLDGLSAAEEETM